VGLFLLGLVVALLWAPGGEGFFALDDFLFLEAYAPGAPRSHPARWLTEVSPVDNAYRPLTTALYFSLSRKLFGLKARGYQWANLFLHVASTLLVAYLCWLMLGDEASALLAGLFYGSRSSLWVAIRWASGIQEMGLAFGSALAAAGLCAYMRRRSPWALLACLAGFLVALGSKEAAAALAIALVPLAAVAPAQGRRLASAFKALAPAAFLTALYLLWRITLTWSHPTIHAVSVEPGRLASRLGAFIFWSIAGRPLPERWGPQAALALALLACAGLIYLWMRGKIPEGRDSLRAFLAGLLFFGLALLPVLAIARVPHQYYLAVPLLGVSVALASALRSLTLAAETRSRSVALVLLVLLGLGIPFQGAWEIRAKDLGQLASGGFYKMGDGAIYEDLFKRLSNLWPSLPQGSSLLIVDYPFDGLISSDIGGRGLEATSTMASMLRVFYGKSSIRVGLVKDQARAFGTVSYREALRWLEGGPKKCFIARYLEGRLEALSVEEALALIRKRLAKAASAGHAARRP
jgi:hypothetical protein